MIPIDSYPCFYFQIHREEGSLYGESEGWVVMRRNESGYWHTQEVEDLPTRDASISHLGLLTAIGSKIYGAVIDTNDVITLTDYDAPDDIADIAYWDGRFTASTISGDAYDSTNDLVTWGDLRSYHGQDSARLHFHEDELGIYHVIYVGNEGYWQYIRSEDQGAAWTDPADTGALWVGGECFAAWEDYAFLFNGHLFYSQNKGSVWQMHGAWFNYEGWVITDQPIAMALDASTLYIGRVGLLDNAAQYAEWRSTSWKSAEPTFTFALGSVTIGPGWDPPAPDWPLSDPLGDAPSVRALIPSVNWVGSNDRMIIAQCQQDDRIYFVEIKADNDLVLIDFDWRVDDDDTCLTWPVHTLSGAEVPPTASWQIYSCRFESLA